MVTSELPKGERKRLVHVLTCLCDEHGCSNRYDSKERGHAFRIQVRRRGFQKGNQLVLFYVIQEQQQPREHKKVTDLQWTSRIRT